MAASILLDRTDMSSPLLTEVELQHQPAVRKSTSKSLLLRAPLKAVSSVAHLAPLPTKAARHSFRTRTFFLLCLGSAPTRMERRVRDCLTMFTFLSLMASMTESVSLNTDRDRALTPLKAHVMYAMEFTFWAIFLVEFSLRMWACTLDLSLPRDPARPHRVARVKGRIVYAMRPLTVCDWLSLLPLPIIWISWLYRPDIDFFGPDSSRDAVSFVLALRLLRMLRLFKLLRYYRDITLLREVVRRRREQLLLAVVTNGVLVVVLSTLAYVLESPVNPKFANIPQALWWGVITLTTVGYGDIYPITPLGRLVAGAFAIVGIGLFTLPASIIATGLVELRQERLANRRRLLFLAFNALERQLLWDKQRAMAFWKAHAAAAAAAAAADEDGASSSSSSSSRSSGGSKGGGDVGWLVVDRPTPVTSTATLPVREVMMLLVERLSRDDSLPMEQVDELRMILRSGGDELLPVEGLLKRTLAAALSELASVARSTMAEG
eukprot:PLAT777.1.p1 GENE.PLAT777.1~~PLAT777.1.p1  ORF type:complete len:492 (-),score=254.08 PLAT777.1:100-1575(-)